MLIDGRPWVCSCLWSDNQYLDQISKGMRWGLSEETNKKVTLDLTKNENGDFQEVYVTLVNKPTETEIREIIAFCRGYAAHLGESQYRIIFNDPNSLV